MILLTIVAQTPTKTSCGWGYYLPQSFLLSTSYSFAMFTCFSPAQKEQQFSRGHFGRQIIYWHFIAWSQKVKRRVKERFRPRRVGWRQGECLRPCHLLSLPCQPGGCHSCKTKIEIKKRDKREQNMKTDKRCLTSPKACSPQPRVSRAAAHARTKKMSMSWPGWLCW